MSVVGAEVDLFYIWNQCITLVQWLLYKNIHFTKNAVKSVVLRLCVCVSVQLQRSFLRDVFQTWF